MADKRDGKGRTGGGGHTAGRRDQPKEALAHRPFANDLKGMKVGPACLACSEPVSAGLGWSLSNPRGSRRPARQGWICGRCLPAEEEKYFKVSYVHDPVRKSYDPVSRESRPSVWIDPATGLPRVASVHSQPLRVPVLSDGDVEDVLAGRRELP